MQKRILLTYEQFLVKNQTVTHQPMNQSINWSYDQINTSILQKVQLVKRVNKEIQYKNINQIKKQKTFENFMDQNQQQMKVIPNCEIDSVIETSDKNKEEFKDYPYRWWIVVLFCFPNMMNGIEWITFSSISTQVQQAYNVSQFVVSLTSLASMFCYIVINFPSNYILSEKGLRIGVFIGIFFTIVGAWIRLLINDSFGWAILGQVFGGIAQPFILNAPTQIAAVWFKPQQRQIATAILSLINVIGVGIGFLFPSFVVSASYSDNTRSEIYNLMLIQAIIITACCIPTVIFFREKPPTPPSHSASVEKSKFSESMCTLIRDKNFIFLYIYFGCILGNFNSVATLINFFLEKFGYSSDDTSYFGAVFIVSGLIGSAILSIVVEKNQKYKLVIIMSTIASILSYSLTMAVLPVEIFSIQLISFFLFGFFATPLIPLSLEFACEITFPISETIGSGLIFKSGQMFGVLQIVISTNVIQIDSQQDVYICMALGLFLQILGLIFMLFIKENLKRKQEEKNQENLKQKDLLSSPNPQSLELAQSSSDQFQQVCNFKI
ncbi:MFS transporter (macronuclear) [Tetrahymena thermophila SB210]|uniref:MFS transporter n=1 Tax=Tetrahymena thermophila (strain SB210) TaxID=312017 RepID=I7M602_TETTS|nr:MFS transporter [Tetrahymena thermophila SB210]EAR83954.2 MFS transporter [Tetrahymena thermophila SB210]|eukprot:XP_001031617.2 MFS transporter [Tetrahymena thermophila SB210]